MVNCHIDSPTFTVGEKKNLTCDLQGLNVTGQSKPEFSVTPPPDPKVNPNWNYEIQFLGSSTIQGATLNQMVTSYMVGSHSLTQVKLKIDGQENLIAPINFEVRSVIPQTGSNPTPFPLMGPESVSIPWWWWTIWGVVLAGAIGLAVWQYLKSKKRKFEALAKAQEEKLTPHQKFQTKIRKLESKGLHNKGEYKAFALELTNIVKKTIGEELSFAAEDLTSEELLATLERRHRAYFNTAGKSLAVFLSDLDQIKFAKIETDAQKCTDLLDRGSRIGNALFGRIG